MQGQLRITLQSQVCPKNREAQNSVVGAPSNTAVSHVPSWHRMNWWDETHSCLEKYAFTARNYVHASNNNNVLIITKYQSVHSQPLTCPRPPSPRAVPSSGHCQLSCHQKGPKSLEGVRLHYSLNWRISPLVGLRPHATCLLNDLCNGSLLSILRPLYNCCMDRNLTNLVMKKEPHLK